MRLDRVGRPSHVSAVFLSNQTAFWLLLLIAPALFLMPITHDEIWHIWVAQQMLHGAKLYRDIIEVNPPLWFWIGVPLAATGLEPRIAVIALFTATIGASLWLCPPRYRLPALVAFTALPLADFGQREHFVLIATAPYVFLLGRRASGEKIHHPLLIGLFAGLGFALKPYFAVAPLALELTMRERLRPELAMLAAFAVAYGAAVLVITPEYLTAMVPMLRDAYGSFGGNDALVLACFAFVLVGTGAVLGRRSGSGVSRELLLSSLAFLFAAAIQAKGWTYHTLPARGFLFLAVCAELMRLRRNPLADALMVGGALLCFWPLGPYSNGFEPEMEQHLAGVPRGSSIVVVANNPSFSWPMVYEHGLRWDLPEMSTWQVQSLFHSQRAKPDAQRLLNIGLAKHPDIVVIDVRPRMAVPTLSLMPPCYLSGYVPHLRTASMQSYFRRDFRGKP